MPVNDVLCLPTHARKNSTNLFTLYQNLLIRRLYILKKNRRSLTAEARQDEKSRYFFRCAQIDSTRWIFVLDVIAFFPFAATCSKYTCLERNTTCSKIPRMIYETSFVVLHLDLLSKVFLSLA